MICLSKSKKTKKNNNNYRLTFYNKSKSITLGSYDQSNNKLIIDILALLHLIGNGVKLSNNFSKIFKKSTGLMLKNKSIIIKY